MQFPHKPDRLSIVAVVARWFPNREIDVSLAETGMSTPVFRVLIDEEVLWVRLGEEPGERRDGEAAAHRRLVADGLPVPEVMRYEAHPPELDRSIMLTAHIRGIPLSDLELDSRDGPIANAAREAGRALAKINRVPVQGFGWAFASSEAAIPVAEHRTRSSWAGEYREASRVVVESNVLEPEVARTLHTDIERWAQVPDSTTGALAHGDFDTTHVYVDPERLVFTGIIDFGELRGADALYDLGHLWLHEGEQGRPRLFPYILDGYGEVTPLPTDAMEQIRIRSLAIGIRALAIQLGRPPSTYRGWLTERLAHLVRPRKPGLHQE